MVPPARPRVGLSKLALAAVIAITTGWTPSTQAPASYRGDESTSAASAGASFAGLRRATARSASPWSASWLGLSSAAPHAPTAHRPERRVEANPVERPVAPERVTAPAKPAFTEPTSKPESTRKGTSSQSSSDTSSHKRTYSGTNHFWIPSLGMSYGVHTYACGRTSTPLNYIYRWGCAGRNNVYLLGHAWGVMKPLHDLYVRGGLRVGMVAVYADGSGRVRKYRVTEWRVVVPTEVAWQLAAQPVPSMTLQTCIGKYSQYRLNVRLVAVN